MGESRRRGTFEDRKKHAIKRDKGLLLKELGWKDNSDDHHLRAGIAPFLARMKPETWKARRLRVLEALKSVHIGTNLENSKPVRVKEDEIGWYLFLCEQALDDPLCTDVSQQSRILPFFVALGKRWQHVDKIKNINQKIGEILNKMKSSPDGLIFEVLVALAYAEKGWEVDLLQVKPPLKSHDMTVAKNGETLFIECKRLERRTSYAESERQDWLRVWDPASNILQEKGQWVWFKGVFHVEVFDLPDNFLLDIFKRNLPISGREQVIYSGPEATIHARVIDKYAVQQHFRDNKVKLHSPMLNHILGGDWAPMDSAVSLVHSVRVSEVAGCEVFSLGAWVDDIGWAAGFTRWFDSEASIDKKAKDVIYHIKEALEQLPTNTRSVVHVAAETMEGAEIEFKRTAKIYESIPELLKDKPLVSVRVHRIQSRQSIEHLWQIDESVDRFNGDILPPDVPLMVVQPEDGDLFNYGHWEI